MKTTNAERQAKYRQKRSPVEGSVSEKRLNTYVSTEAFDALNVLSERYDMTKKQVLEKVLIDELKSLND